MAYFHNVQQTRNSGLDREMRLAADPEFVSFVRSKRKLLALKNFTVKEQWSICSLFGSIYAISTCHSLGKIKTQKNPAIKDWIIENKKNGRDSESAEPSSVRALFQLICQPD